MTKEPIEVMSAEEARQRLIGSISNQFNNNSKEAEAFVDAQIKRLHSELANMELTQSDGENEVGLMERLIQSGLFPSFSFPLDVATFEVAGTKMRPGKSKSQPYIYARTGQDLKVALSEFQPGKRLTINKQSFLVEGVGVSFPENPINNVESLEFDKPRYNPLNPTEFYEGATEWSYFHRCEAEGCNYIIATTDAKWNINEEESCPNCRAIHGNSGQLKSTRIFTPEVFRPRIIPYDLSNDRHDDRLDQWQNSNKGEMRAREESEETARPIRLGRPTLPTPLTSNIEEEGFIEINFESKWRNITAYRFDESAHRAKKLATVKGDTFGINESNKSAQLLLVNAGPNGNGYSICSKCGLVNLQGDTAKHHRPYAIEKAKVEHFVRTQKNLEITILSKKVDEEKDKQKKAELQSELDQMIANRDEDFELKMKELWFGGNKPGEAMNTCAGHFTSKENDTNICLGMTFRTDIFLLRIEILAPITDQADIPPFDAAFRAIKEALITEATEELELVNREISGNLRSVVAVNKTTGETSRYMDIYLFDNASGGAGLVREIGEENIVNILERLKIRLSGEKCVDGPCSRVCIGCLLDFRNQMESDRMDRKLGYQILSYLSGDSNTINFRIIGGELVNGEMQNIVDNKITEKEVENLSSIFSNLTFETTGERTFKVDNKETNGNRNVYVYSSLEGPNQLPNDPIEYKSAKTYYSNLHEREVSMPYEMLRDSPHMLIHYLYEEDENDDEEENWFSGAPE